MDVLTVRRFGEHPIFERYKDRNRFDLGDLHGSKREIGFGDWKIEDRYGIIREVPNNLLILLRGGCHRRLDICARPVAPTRFVT